ncbi:hypothetical protein BKA70DRAFT_1307162 [Coprinopsis sp. MPI-PUGE-AT-0042]|nr:hypothetical protein BKA70DRAFT_1307162 [Coprinopsis sp. MPI-PUGE-AT-0042]
MTSLSCIVSPPTSSLIPDFDIYLKGNTPLPAHFLPVLEVHMSQLVESIDKLDSEILTLDSEPTLKVNREALQLLERERDAHAKLKAPIRSIPPEVLGLIFGYLFDDKPFEGSDYRQFVSIACVCSTWREVVHTTPNLCKGLTIDPTERPSLLSEKGSGRTLSLQASWRPWLAVASRGSSYHLSISPKYDVACSEPFVRYLLASSPSPDTLTFDSTHALNVSLRSTAKHPTVRRLIITERVDGTDFQRSPLSNVFPNLRNLAANCRIDTRIYPPWKHDHLRTLHMQDLTALPFDFAKFLTNLPCLEELQISSKDLFDIDDMGHASHIILPSVTPDTHCPRRGLVLLFETASAFQASLGNLFRDAPLQPLTVALQGDPFALFLTLVIKTSPSRTRLYLDLEYLSINTNGGGSDLVYGARTISIDSDNISELFCSTMAGDLHWLSWGSPCRRRDSALKMYISSESGVAEENNLEARRGDLQALGYDLEICKQETWDAMLRSSIPQIDYQWEANSGSCTCPLKSGERGAAATPPGITLRFQDIGHLMGESLVGQQTPGAVYECGRFSETILLMREGLQLTGPVNQGLEPFISTLTTSARFSTPRRLVIFIGFHGTAPVLIEEAII